MYSYKLSTLASLYLYICILASFIIPFTLSGSCTHLNACSGHGICDTENSRCNCYTGWGAIEDKALYRAPDCSLRM